MTDLLISVLRLSITERLASVLLNPKKESLSVSGVCPENPQMYPNCLNVLLYFGHRINTI